jgi:hypothetical protein
VLPPIGHEVEVAQWRAVNAGVFLACVYQVLETCAALNDMGAQLGNDPHCRHFPCKSMQKSYAPVCWKNGAMHRFLATSEECLMDWNSNRGVIACAFCIWGQAVYLIEGEQLAIVDFFFSRPRIFLQTSN